MHRNLSLAARLGRGTALAFCLLSLTAIAQPARQWTVIELTPDVAAGGIARDANNRGDVVGHTFTAGSSFFSAVPHAFLWENGTRVDLGAGVGTRSVAWAINEQGTIAGMVDGTAYMWKDGNAVSLQAAGEARAVNARDEIAGSYWTGGAVGSGSERPFLFRDGVFFELPTLGGAGTATDINDQGIAVGYTLVANTSTTHGVLWENGAVRDLGTLGGQQSFAERINNAGVIVGRAQEANGAYSMARWQAGGGPAEKLLTGGAPTGINNRGDIVGSNLYTGGSFLYRDGVVTSLVDLPAMQAGGWQAFTPWGISDRGWIVGSAWKPGAPFWGTALLLIPH